MTVTPAIQRSVVRAQIPAYYMLKDTSKLLLK